jgi:hypothetical protein
MASMTPSKTLFCLALAACVVSATANQGTSAGDVQGELISAINRGDTQAVRELVGRGADVNAVHPDSAGKTPLQLSAIYGHAEIARILIAHGAEPDAKSDDNDRTALILAVRRAPMMGVGEARALQVVRILIANGADVNARDSSSATALMFASLDGYRTIVQELIAHGADVNARDAYGETALIMAQREGHTEIVADLKRAGAR